MKPTRYFLFLFFAFAAISAQARLGETLAQLREHFGTPPDPKSPRGMVVWFVESVDGPLVYTVTLNAKGISIAEGMKSVKRGIMTQKIVQDFLEDQMTLTRDSKTARVVPPGEKYEFAKTAYTCGEKEWVLVDDTRGVLLIWSRAGTQSVMAVTHEMMQRPAS
ncbi:MAG: hypothetical protein JWQ83_1103 [Lacunisphaera sp.]|nr:hypothetical protein [Lacunisphaera sp.]